MFFTIFQTEKDEKWIGMFGGEDERNEIKREWESWMIWERMKGKIHFNEIRI